MAEAGAKRWLIWVVGAIVAFVLMGQDDSGCSTETVDEPDSDQTSNGGKRKPKQKVARVGNSISLDGTDTRMKVTVLKVVDPLQGGEFDEPQNQGARFIGVQIRLKNVGDGPYDDSPSNGAELIMGNDTQADSALLTGGECSSDFGSSAKIGPGNVQQGCIPFEAKQGLRPKTFQFTLDSGFGPKAGEWRLR